MLRAFLTAPSIFWDIFPVSVPYLLVVGLFALFVVWNGGIVLGKFLWNSSHLFELTFRQVTSQTMLPLFMCLRSTTLLGFRQLWGGLPWCQEKVVRVDYCTMYTRGCLGLHGTHECGYFPQDMIYRGFE